MCKLLQKELSRCLCVFLRTNLRRTVIFPQYFVIFLYYFTLLHLCKDLVLWSVSVTIMSFTRWNQWRRFSRITNLFHCYILQYMWLVHCRQYECHENITTHCFKYTSATYHLLFNFGQECSNTIWSFEHMTILYLKFSKQNGYHPTMWIYV